MKDVHIGHKICRSCGSSVNIVIGLRPGRPGLDSW